MLTGRRSLRQAGRRSMKSRACLGPLVLITTLAVSCRSSPPFLLDPLETASLDSSLLRVDGQTLPALTPAFPSRVRLALSRVAPDSVFEFSFAMSSSRPVPRARVEYSVAVKENARPPIRVFSETLRAHQANQWHRGAVDLKPWIGKDVSLVLEIRPASTEVPAPWSDRILTAWGGPRLASRTWERRMSEAGAFARRLCPRLVCEPTVQESPSVIILVVDALRADYLGTYGFRGEISPNLDRMAVESVLFENCFSQAPWTKPSIASLFTSLYPLTHGLTDHLGKFWSANSPELRTGVLPEQAVTLAEVFRGAGYRTAAFVGNPWIGPEFGFDQGFETYGTPQKTHILLNKARAWLDALPPGVPFFLYVHLMGVHSPYQAREKDYQKLRGSRSLGPDRRLTEKEYRQIAAHIPSMHWETAGDHQWLNAWKAKYAGGVRKADRDIGALLEHLSRVGVLDRSLIVLTSDHGEEFLEHGFWEHGAELCDHQLHVPLWIRRPDAEGAGRRVSDVVGLVDLMPTLLSLASIPALPSGQGRDFSSSLLGGDSRKSSQLSFSTATTTDPGLHVARDGRYKLVWEGDTDSVRLFDLAVDPDETQDLSAAKPELARELRLQLLAHLQSVSARALSKDTAPLTKEVRERLKSLGYLQ